MFSALSKKMPQQLTLTDFCKEAEVRQSESVLMEWEVSLFGKLCGIVEAINTDEAKRSVHRSAIHSSLFSNSGAIRNLFALDLPGLHVLADYPELQGEYDSIVKKYIFGNHFSKEELSQCSVQVEKIYYHSENMMLDVLKLEVSSSGLCESILSLAEKKQWVLNGIVFAEKYWMNFVRPNEQLKPFLSH